MSGSRPKRKAAEVANLRLEDNANPKRKKFDMVSWLQDIGYQKFNATERYHSDGNSSCSAKLFYHTRHSGNEKEMPIVKSGGKGHSEVAVVSEFVKVKCEYDIAAFYQYLEAGVKMQCESKSVCVKCARFLGLLCITPYNMHTTKCALSMDLTEWGMEPNMRKFFLEFVQDRYPDKSHQITEDVLTRVNA
jgi:hypothetical protein